MRDIYDKCDDEIHAAGTEYVETIHKAITEASSRRAARVEAAYRELHVERERRMTIWERGEPVTVRGRAFDMEALGPVAERGPNILPRVDISQIESMLREPKLAAE